PGSAVWRSPGRCTPRRNRWPTCRQTFLPAPRRGHRGCDGGRSGTGPAGRRHEGDWWDYVANDPEHKSVLAVVPGARVGECAEEVVEEVKERLGDRPPGLFTNDEHAAYESAIVTAFSEPEPAGPPAGPAPAAAGSGLGLCDGSQRAEEGTGRVHPAINC